MAGMAKPEPILLKLGRAVDKFYSNPKSVRDKMILKQVRELDGTVLRSASSSSELSDLAMMRVLLNLAEDIKQVSTSGSEFTTQ